MNRTWLKGSTQWKRGLRGARQLVLLCILACACACAPQVPTATATTTQRPTPPPTATAFERPSETPSPGALGPVPSPTLEPILCAERVMIISLDGMRPDAVTPQGTPNTFMLSRRGAYSWTAQTILPSATLPGHASMLSGYDVPGHGLYWNDYIEARGYIRSSTVFSIAHEHGFHTVMIVGKQKLLHIATPGTVDDFSEIRGGGDLLRADEAIEIIFEGFGVFFLHFRGPDNAGHRYGWMSPGYLEVVGEADMCVGDVLDALRWTDLDDTTLVILTSDHGGHGRTHGSDRPEDMTIPWIIAGPGVIPGLELTSEVRVYDTTATALWALGLPLPEDLDGIPVVEAFDERVEAECQLMEALR